MINFNLNYLLHAKDRGMTKNLFHLTIKLLESLVFENYKLKISYLKSSDPEL